MQHCEHSDDFNSKYLKTCCAHIVWIFHCKKIGIFEMWNTFLCQKDSCFVNFAGSGITYNCPWALTPSFTTLLTSINSLLIVGSVDRKQRPVVTCWHHWGSVLCCGLPPHSDRDALALLSGSSQVHFYTHSILNNIKWKAKEAHKRDSHSCSSRCSITTYQQTQVAFVPTNCAAA